jgi:hypothetical protein
MKRRRRRIKVGVEVGEGNFLVAIIIIDGS